MAAARLGASPDAIADAVACAVHSCWRWNSPCAVAAAPVVACEVDRAGVWLAEDFAEHETGNTMAAGDEEPHSAQQVHEQAWQKRSEVGCESIVGPADAPSATRRSLKPQLSNASTASTCTHAGLLVGDVDSVADSSDDPGLAVRFTADGEVWPWSAPALGGFLGTQGEVNLAAYGAALRGRALQCHECNAFNLPGDDFCICCLAGLRRRTQDCIATDFVAVNKRRVALEQRLCA